VTLLAIFSKKWIIPTILVVLGMVLLVRLGYWQLDRLQQKRDFNAMMAERWRSEPLDLNTELLPADPGGFKDLEYRRVSAQGQWDYEHQVLISNQTFQGTGGYVVVTPLVLGDNRAVLVARGWIPADLAEPAALAQLDEKGGIGTTTPIIGLARKSQGLPGGGISTPPATPQSQWYRIDVPAIQGQMPYQLEPGYLEQMPEPGRTYNAMPIRSEPIALDEGNHLSYAIQWFTFAVVLGFGYIMLVRHRTRLAAGLIKPVDPVGPVGPAPGPAPDMPDANEPILAGEQPRPVH
jgi:surfeit locus 1 family protein